VENLLKAVVSGRSNSSFIQYLKEPYAIVATEPHPQHGLLQAHPLVAISSRHAPHLLLPRIPRGHVRRNHARHAAVHHQIQFRRPGLHPRRRRRSPPRCPRSFLTSPEKSAWATRRASSTSSRVKTRSEEHTSQLQSRFDLACPLLPEKNNL